MPVSESTQSSLNSYLESNLLSSKNNPFFNQALADLADLEISIVHDYLIIQVKRFLGLNQAVTQDINKTTCTPTLTVAVTLDEEIVGHKKFILLEQLTI